VRFSRELVETAKRVQSARTRSSKELDLTADNLRKLQELGHLQKKELDFLAIDNKTKEFIETTFGKLGEANRNSSELHFGVKGIKEEKLR